MSNKESNAVPQCDYSQDYSCSAMQKQTRCRLRRGHGDVCQFEQATTPSPAEKLQPYFTSHVNAAESAGIEAATTATITSIIESELPPLGEWRDISSAPKDGTRILAVWPYWSKTRPVVAWYDPAFGCWEGETKISSGPDPELWQPLPPLPAPPESTTHSHKQK